MSSAFPAQDTIKDLVAESGWTTSPKNLAYWFPKDGKIYVKLDIASILATVGGENMGNLSGIIEQVLNGQPAMIKELLKTVGFDLDKVSDASLSICWVWLRMVFLWYRFQKMDIHIYI